MRYLVTGASSGYGRLFAEKLREEHEVYEAQRGLGKKDFLDPTEKLLHWNSCDFEDPSDMVKLVKFFVDKKVELDGIIFSAVYRQKCENNILQIYEFQKHVIVNAIMPMMLLLSFCEWKVLKDDARIMFCLDRTLLEKEYTAYKVSKVIIPQIVETFLDVLPIGLKCTYALLSSKKNEGVIDKAVNVFSGKEKSSRLLDLT